MALKFMEKLRNPKNRNFVLLGGFLLLILILILYFSTKKSDVLGAKESKTSAPPQITSIPGGTTSARYQQLQEEENKKRAEAAKKSGTSAVATIIGARSKDALSGKESFGIEGLIGPQTPACNCGPQLAPDVTAALLNQLEANPDAALDLLRKNPGLAKALCKQKPDLALKIMEKDIEAAKLILRECPELAKILAQRNPALFKKLMLEDPELAKLIAANDPELMKQLLLSDPDFAKKMAASNPDLIKDLMKNDPDFANKMAKAYPDLVKQLMKNDPAFAKAMMQNNPQMVKDLMLNDPDFARAMALNNPDAVKALMDGDPAFAKALLAKVPDLKDTLKVKLAPPATTDQERLKAFDDAKQRALAADAAARLQAQQADQYQKQLQALASAMENQSKAVFQSWNEVSTQQFIQGEASKNGGKDQGPEGPLQLGSSGSGANEKPAGPPVIKAGTIMFASLDTAVNSDEPGPVLATIVAGPLKGSRVLGTMSVTNVAGSFPERVTLNFTTLSIPDRTNSSSIQAVAIDPDTARTALATDVDHHYLLRYSAMFASAFMKGYAQVLTSQGTTTTTATNGLATTTQSPTLPSSQQLLAALGEVGKKWGEAVQDVVKRPYTVTVAAGTGIGLLFLSDVTESS